MDKWSIFVTLSLLFFPARPRLTSFKTAESKKKKLADERGGDSKKSTRENDVSIVRTAQKC